MKYSFMTGLSKTLINTALFGLPVLVQMLPAEWMNLTLGSALYMFLNYAKIKWAEGTPNQ